MHRLLIYSLFGLFSGGLAINPSPNTPADWAISANETRDFDFTPNRSSFQVSKRGHPYSLQADAPVELIVLSTPKGENYEERKGYKYPSEAGSGIFIYHIEFGIAPQFSSVFKDKSGKTRVLPALNVPGPKNQEKQTFEKLQHSACVADKAMGEKNGAAKKAYLVPVILPNVASSKPFAEALAMIVKDVKNKARYKNSIVMFSLAFDLAKLPKDEIDIKKAPWSDAIKSMNDLFNLGVPIVTAAGNRGDDDPSERVNRFPQIFEGQPWKLPLINVGSAYTDGEIDPESKRGPLVTVYANGLHNECLEETEVFFYGTSYSSPQVAGGLGTLMSQKDGPFHKATHQLAGTRDFVIAAKDFIMGKASYQRGEARMFWNMAP